MGEIGRLQGLRAAARRPWRVKRGSRARSAGRRGHPESAPIRARARAREREPLGGRRPGHGVRRAIARSSTTAAAPPAKLSTRSSNAATRASDPSRLRPRPADAIDSRQGGHGKVVVNNGGVTQHDDVRLEAIGDGLQSESAATRPHRTWVEPPSATGVSLAAVKCGPLV